jgi:hypothetical protein
MGWATFWATFSRTHLVALPSTYFSTARTTLAGAAAALLPKKDPLASSQSQQSSRCPIGAQKLASVFHRK